MEGRAGRQLRRGATPTDLPPSRASGIGSSVDSVRREASRAESRHQGREVIVGAVALIAGLGLAGAGGVQLLRQGIHQDAVVLVIAGASLALVGPTIFRGTRRRRRLLQTGTVTTGQVIGVIEGDHGPRGLEYSFVGPDGVSRQGRVENLPAAQIDALLRLRGLPVVYNPANLDEHEGDVFGERAGEARIAGFPPPRT